MIAIGCDHAGFQLKQAVVAYLREQGQEFQDFGSGQGESVDYPNVARSVTGAITSGECQRGILICGTGIGMSMAANRVRGIRAALCGDTFSARMTRMHNDANVLCMGQRVIGEGLALDIVALFLSTAFEGGRHQRRIDGLEA